MLFHFMMIKIILITLRIFFVLGNIGVGGAGRGRPGAGGKIIKKV